MKRSVSNHYNKKNNWFCHIFHIAKKQHESTSGSHLAASSFRAIFRHNSPQAGFISLKPDALASFFLIVTLSSVVLTFASINYFREKGISNSLAPDAAQNSARPLTVLSADIGSFESLTLDGDAKIGGDLYIKGEKLVIPTFTAGEAISIDGTSDITISNNGVTSLQSQTGDLKLTAGNGITIDGLTITNNAPNAIQSTFEFIKVTNNETSATFGASKSNDTLTFVAGGNINIASDTTNKKVTISSTATGWQLSGSNVYLSDSTYNVGIGTTAPTAKLDVAGTASISGALKLYGTPTLQSTANQTLTLGGNTTGNIALLPLNGSGYVGIGTSSPSRLLELSSTQPILGFTESDGSTDNKNWIINPTGETLYYQVVNDAESIGTAYLQVDRTGTTVDYVSIPNGNFGVGTTSPSYIVDIVKNGAAQIHVSATAVDSGGYIQSLNPGDLFLIGGAQYNGANWIAKTTTSGAFKVDSTGNLHLAADSGLVAGNSFTPTDRMYVTTGGNVFINDNANTLSTIGLTINQGANDNEIIALKSGDVAGAWTLLTETDTYGYLSKASANEGGLTIHGLAESNDEKALLLKGTIDFAAVETTKSTAGSGVIVLNAALEAVNTDAAVAADGNLVSIENNGTTTHIFDADGDTWQNGNITAAGTTGLTFTGTGGQINFTNGETIDNDTDGQITVTAGILDLQSYAPTAVNRIVAGNSYEGTSTAYGIVGTRFQGSVSNANSLIGVQGNGHAYALGLGNTLTWAKGIVGIAGHNGGTNPGTVTNAAALYASSIWANSGGVTTSGYGLYVESQTAATNDYGVYIAGADTYALWVDAGTSRFDGPIQLQDTTSSLDSLGDMTFNLDSNNDQTGRQYVWAHNATGSSGTGLMYLTEAPLLLINDTANAQSTIGFTINQGANDNEILTLKSSDVAHGLTAMSETDSYGYFQKNDSTAGGLSVGGFSETNVGINLSGFVTTVNSTKSTSGIAAINLRAGGNNAALAADSNLVAIENYGSKVWIADADGDTWQNGTLTVAGTGNSSFAGNVGIGTTAPSAPLHVGSNITVTAAGTHRGTIIGPTAIGTVASATTTFDAAQIAWTQNMTGGTNTITDGAGLRIANPTITFGAISNNYGIRVDAQTAGTGDYGIRVDAADTATLWLSGNADNTTAAAGIQFGASRDTNLYRSAADTLKTDDAFVSATNIYAGAVSGATRVQILGAGSTNAVAEFYSTELNPRWTIGRDAVTSGSSGIAFGDTSNTIAAGGSAIGITSSSGVAVTRTLGLYTSNGSALTERMRIDASGNVGIGTTAPTSLLDVNNTTTSAITAGANARILNIQGALTEAASGVHARIAGVEITPPTITTGVATVTDTASLYVSAAPTATVTGGNYALWVDSGSTRLDGALDMSTMTSSSAGFGIGIAPSTSISINVDRITGNSARSAEYNFANFENSGFQLTGNVADQRDVVLKGSTFTGDIATRTITNYATLYVAAAGTAGANAAITNNYALWVDSGTSRLDGNVGIGASPATSTLVVTGSPGDHLSQFTNGSSTNGSAAIYAVSNGGGATGPYYGVYGAATTGGANYGGYFSISSPSSKTGYALYADAGSGAGTEYAAALMNGNVGIGTTTPGELLNVYATEPYPVIGPSTAHHTLYSGHDAQVTPSLEIYGNNAEYVGLNLVNNKTSGSDTIALLSFANENIGSPGTDIRVATMGAFKDGAENSGYLNWSTMNAGTIAEKMKLNRLGNLTLTSANVSGTTTTSAFSLAANSTTTGTAAYISATAITTGKALDIAATISPADGSTLNGVVNSTFTNSPTVSANTMRATYQTINDSTALANTVDGIGSVINLSGNAAKSARAITTYFSDSSTTGDTLSGILQTGGASGALATGQTRNIYGINSAMTSTAATAQATAALNMYGGYFIPSSTGATAGTDTVYGVYTSTTATHAADAGTVNQYGVYIANGTSGTNGTATKYGLYVESPTGADTNYAAVFAGGNVGIGLTNPSTALDVVGAGKVSTTFTAGTGITATTGDIQTTTGKFVTGASGQTVGLQLDGYVDAGSFNNYILNNSPNAGTYATLNFGRTTGTLFGFIRSNNNTQAMELGTAATTRLSIDTSGQVALSTTGSTGGLLIGADTQLYRSAANIMSLASGDSLYVESGQVRVRGTGGHLIMLDKTDNALDEKKWDFAEGATTFLGRAMNDAENSTSNWLTVTRSAMTISGIDLSATTVTIPGSGGLTIGGDTNLTRGAANRLDLASGDSLYLVNGGGGAMSIGAVPSAGIGLYISNDYSYGSGEIHGMKLGEMALTQTSATGNSVQIASFGIGSSITINSGVAHGVVSNVYFSMPTLTETTGTITTAANIYVEGAPTAGNNNYALYVAAGATSLNGTVEIAAPSTANTTALCWDNAGASLIYDCNGSATDLAELYGTADSSIEAADIVVAVDEAQEIADPSEGKHTSRAFIAKSTAPYQSALLGVISTNPNQVYGEDGVFSPSDNPRPVSLAGRVPVKVSTENGAIHTGDAITSSSIPGVGMRATKAGRIVGTALQSYSGEGIGSVIVFVNPSYFLGTAIAQNVSEDPLFSILDSVGAIKNQYQGQVLSSNQMQKLINEQSAVLGIATEGTATLAASLTTLSGTVGALETHLSAQEAAIASISATLANLPIINLTQFATGSAVLGITIVEEDFAVTGNTTLSNLNTIGNITVANNLTLGATSINTVGEDLQIQPLKQGNVSFMNGLVTIDTTGNVVITGTVSADSLSLTKDKTIGSSTIPAGTTSVTITTTAVYANSKIFLTPTASTSSKIIYVSNKTSGTGFTASLDGEASTTDIIFDWLIVEARP